MTDYPWMHWPFVRSKTYYTSTLDQQSLEASRAPNAIIHIGNDNMNNSILNRTDLETVTLLNYTKLPFIQGSTTQINRPDVDALYWDELRNVVAVVYEADNQETHFYIPLSNVKCMATLARTLITMPEQLHVPPKLVESQGEERQAVIKPLLVPEHKPELKDEKPTVKVAEKPAKNAKAK